jgi:hypothetical protein
VGWRVNTNENTGINRIIRNAPLTSLNAGNANIYGGTVSVEWKFELFAAIGLVMKRFGTENIKWLVAKEMQKFCWFFQGLAEKKDAFVVLTSYPTLKILLTRLPPLGSDVVGDIVWMGVVVGAFDVVWRTVLLSWSTGGLDGWIWIFYGSLLC